MYTITFDPDAHRLLIVTSGFWSIQTTAAFSAEVLARGTAARVRYGAFSVLADLRLAAVQAPKVIEEIETMIPKALRITTAPIAAVASSMLAKMQTERYLRGDNCRTFLDIDEASAWLDERLPRPTIR